MSVGEVKGVSPVRIGLVGPYHLPGFFCLGSLLVIEFFLRISSGILLVITTCLLDCGCPRDEYLNLIPRSLH